MLAHDQLVWSDLRKGSIWHLNLHFEYPWSHQRLGEDVHGSWFLPESPSVSSSLLSAFPIFLSILSPPEPSSSQPSWWDKPWPRGSRLPSCTPQRRANRRLMPKPCVRSSNMPLTPRWVGGGASSLTLHGKVGEGREGIQQRRILWEWVIAHLKMPINSLTHICICFSGLWCFSPWEPSRSPGIITPIPRARY